MCSDGKACVLMERVCSDGKACVLMERVKVHVF